MRLINSSRRRAFCPATAAAAAAAAAAAVRFCVSSASISLTAAAQDDAHGPARDEARERRSVESRESGGTSITPSRAARAASLLQALPVEAESWLA